jgi:uncharacterized protein
MPEDLIGYQRLVERALRGVVRDALAGIAQTGLPGRHQVYVTFRTDHPGVVIADALRARYPRDMTIVLQFEFWDLEVDDEGFGVTLSFNNLPQRLWVPFAAVRLFTDPTAEFGLQFNVPEPEHAPVPAPVPLPLAAESPAASREQRGDAGEAAEADEDKPAGEKVVSLDRFRSK